MAIFTLDEELNKLTVNGSCAIIDDEDSDDTFIEPHQDMSQWHKNLLLPNPQAIPPAQGFAAAAAAAAPSILISSPNGVSHAGTATKPRRRSSLYNKFPINTPPNTKRFSLAAEESTGPTGQGLGERESFSKNHGPRQLEDFRPLKVLGQGAYGKVLLVKDVHTSKLYAMKQLRKAEILIAAAPDDARTAAPEPASMEKRIERTFAERTILSQLEHPNIVKLFYSFHDSHRLYLVLQYIPGGELFYHLKEQGTLDEQTVSFYAAEISCALKFLHDRGIVYRDLKPENCLLNDKGHLVLTDFGLSKKSVGEAGSPDATATETSHDGEPVTALYSIIGTPEYCAPEILQGVPYTQICDWYSLGCLVYDMLIGKPPYTGANHKVILHKIVKDKTPKIPMYLSDGMKDFLGALLKKDVGKRWDVDRYWSEDGPRPKKKKAGQAKTTGFQKHFVFRKINWKSMETGDLQRSSTGPILPIITDWELAENFDSEFTEMRLDSDAAGEGLDIDVGVKPVAQNSMQRDAFQGFSYVASTSYLERYF